MTSPSVLDDRYRRTSTTRTRVWLIVGIAIAALVVGWFGWATITNPANGVRSDGVSYAVEDRAVTVTFQLTAPVGTAVACAIEALDEDYGVVGWKVVEFPAADLNVRAFSQTGPTVARATTGLVNSCWLP